MKGITVILKDRIETGKDPFNRPIYVENEVAVDNVLVAPAQSQNLQIGRDMEGRKLAFILAIPKGDGHNWTDKTVVFFGQEFHTIGVYEEGIEHLIPLSWNKKVLVERYE